MPKPNANTLKKSYEPDFTRTADEVKKTLYEQGLTLKEWAEKNGYKPVQVYRVMRGENKALYGEGHRIAVAIGLKSQ
jgi:gp16 family phage-associated protein